MSEIEKVKMKNVAKQNAMQTFEDQKRMHAAKVLADAQAMGLNLVPSGGQGAAPDNGLAEWAAIQDMIAKNRQYNADKGAAQELRQLENYMPIQEGADADANQHVRLLNEAAAAKARADKYRGGVDEGLASQWTRFSN